MTGPEAAKNIRHDERAMFFKIPKFRRCYGGAVAGFGWLARLERVTLGERCCDSRSR